VAAGRAGDRRDRARPDAARHPLRLRVDPRRRRRNGAGRW
jgi:hypothetical protein